MGALRFVATAIGNGQGQHDDGPCVLTVGSRKAILADLHMVRASLEYIDEMTTNSKCAYPLLEAP